MRYGEEHRGNEPDQLSRAGRYISSTAFKMFYLFLIHTVTNFMGAANVLRPGNVSVS